MELFGYTPERLLDEVGDSALAPRPQELRRVLAHFISKGADGWEGIPPLRNELRQLLDERYDRRRLKVVERVEDSHDKFVKLLLEAPDGELFETVRIPLHKPGRFSVCVSSQVGCAMGCDFCATGRLGLRRNLRAWEMVAQWDAVRRDLRSRGEGEVRSVVFMGQGEPLHNYDEVIRAAQVLSHPCGARITSKTIRISTVGLIAPLRRYAAERQPYPLIVSLTSAVPERRRQLLPVAGKADMAELVAVLKELAEVGRSERITLAWVLMGGVNSGSDEIDALERWLGEVPFRLNIIDVNDARPDGYRRASDDERETFVDALQRLRVPFIRRYSGGTNREAACGMLHNRAFADR